RLFPFEKLNTKVKYIVQRFFMRLFDFYQVIYMQTSVWKTKILASLDSRLSETIKNYVSCRNFIYMDKAAQTISLYQPLLHTIAYNLVRCKQDAEDIVQETFIKWLTIDHEKVQNTKAYLVRAVTNNCLNHL